MSPKPIPETTNALVLRTDFSDPAAWESLRKAVQEPEKEFGFLANLDLVSDPEYRDLTTEQVLALIPEASNRSFLFIVDRTTLSRPDQPILVVDLFEQRGRSFRVVPSEMWSVENNLSIANMDFEEFADSVDADGVFRGFPGP
jgi:Domain of unknown function (DUF6924)